MQSSDEAELKSHVQLFIPSICSKIPVYKLKAFAVPLSSSMFIVEMLSALATGEITGTLKMLEVGGSLEH